ncbi:MAG: hypothetical protein EAX96_09610 [Candidatus Lokiarchaeota archaeon]|nr:hypothetical protein [Candidatus Lokiarchaeota archaeon]
MSKDFANFMESVKEQPLEDQVNEISDILTKVMAIVVSAIDDLTQRMSMLEQTLQDNANNIETIKNDVNKLQQGAPPTLPPQPQLLGTPPEGVSPPPPPPKPAPKPMSPLSARSAINSELKALFSKRKA